MMSLADRVAATYLARTLLADDLDYDEPVDRDDPTGDIESMKRGDRMRFARLDTFWKKTSGALLAQTKKDLEALAQKTNSDVYKQEVSRLSKLIVSVIKSGEQYDTLKKALRDKLWTYDLDAVLEKLLGFETQYEDLTEKLWAGSNLVKQWKELTRLERFLYRYNLPNELREEYKELEDKKLPAVKKCEALPNGAHPPFGTRGAWLGGEVSNLLGAVLREKHKALATTSPEELAEEEERDRADAKRLAEMKKAMSSALSSYSKKLLREIEKAFVVEWNASDIDVYGGSTGKWGQAKMILSHPRRDEFLSLQLKVEDFDESKLSNATLTVALNVLGGPQKWTETYNHVPDPKAIVGKLPREELLAITLQTSVYDWHDHDYTTRIVGLNEKAVRREAVKYEAVKSIKRIEDRLDDWQTDQEWNLPRFRDQAAEAFRDWLAGDGDSASYDEQDKKEAELYAEADRKAEEEKRQIASRRPAQKAVFEAEAKETIAERTRYISWRAIKDLIGFSDAAKSKLVDQLNKKPSAVLQVPYEG
jgi:hypothetical protein